jgi:aminopeptidase N
MKSYAFERAGMAEVAGDMADIGLSARGGEFSPAGTPKVYPPDMQLEPVHTLLDLRVDVAGKALSGTVTHTIEAKVAGKREITLHGVDLRDVAVKDAGGHALTFSYDGREIRVTWEKAFKAGEKRELAITYSVHEPASGLYFGGPDKHYPKRKFWCGTDHETERARHWLPCIDLPAVRTTLEFRLRCDAAFTVAANGFHVSTEQHTDGTKTENWKLEQRCPSYLLAFCIGDFTVCDDGEAIGIPVSYYTTSDFTEAQLKRSFGGTKAMLEWMPTKLGMKFPWPKYGQYALQNIGGAMENISLVSWDDVFVADEKLHAEWGWLIDKINLHEMSHTYFGDAIVCRDYAHAWLKESWAVYIEQCWHEDTQSEDEGLFDFIANATAYINEADNRYSRPIMTRAFQSSWDMYDRHLYPGGACRLHTLRRELGDEIFWKATADYLNTYNGKVVETDDFRLMMEKHSGRSLVKFFDQWFMTAGYPSVKCSFSYDAAGKTGTFEVEQAQAGKDGATAFELRTSLGWWIGGKKHTRDVLLERAKHAFTVAMDAEPEMVRFDPDCRVLVKLDMNPGQGKLEKQLHDAPDVIGRILAARELAKIASGSAVAALAKACGSEKFWGARNELAKALETVGNAAAVAALAEHVAAEKHPQVMEQVIRSAGAFRDARVRDAIEKRTAKGDLCHRAQMVAYEVLGAQREFAPYDLLEKAASRETFGAWAQGGAMRGLAATRKPEAAEKLLSMMPYGKAPHRARTALAGAIGMCAEWADKPLKKRIAETLVDALRDPHYAVRKAASGALAAAKLGEGCDAMEAFGAPLSVQERLMVERQVKGIRAGGDPKVPALQKQVEDLQDKARKLEERLRKMEDGKGGAAAGAAKKAKAGKSKAAKSAKGKKPKKKGKK